MTPTEYHYHYIQYTTDPSSRSHFRPPGAQDSIFGFVVLYGTYAAAVPLLLSVCSAIQSYFTGGFWNRGGRIISTCRKNFAGEFQNLGPSLKEGGTADNRVDARAL